MTSIRVHPIVGEFNDVETSLVFVIPFTIQNLSTVAKNVRFVLPKTPVFRLVNTPQVIAPGLKHTVEIEFFTKAASDYHDQWSVVTDDGRIDIPLHAVFPCPSLQVDTIVDLGKVMVQHNVQPNRPITIRNVGKKDGSFKLVYDAAIGLTVQPPSGVVKAGGSQELRMDYFGSEVGLFRATVTVELDDHATKRIDVNAEVIDARVSVVHPLTNEPVTAVTIGTVFFGQKKKESIFLVNNSPNTVSFTMHSPEEPEGAGGDDESDAPSLPMECMPMEGRIPAYGRTELHFAFQPVMVEMARGWGHQTKTGDELMRKWDPTFTVEIVETEQKIEVQVLGKAYATEVSMSQSTFRFGSCEVNNHQEIMFQVKNDSTELPLLYHIDRVAHFFASPSVARVPAKGIQNVTVSFHPNQLGRFRNQLTMTVNEGTRILHLVVSGHATQIGEKIPLVGGIDKIASDFKKKTIFVKPQSSPNLRGVASEGSGEFREVGTTEPTWLSDPEMDPNDILLLSEWEQKREHNKLYQRYLMNSRHNRVVGKSTQGGIDNPDDLGMIPGEGLTPPEPTIQFAEDPLPWGGQGRNGGGQDSKKATAMRTATNKFDEARVVKKTYKQTPTTLNEQRECKLALSPKEIQQIGIPVKVIDFGQCNVFSKNTKPFFVHNESKTHILVAIPVHIRDELALSKPPSQVIPPGQTAAFDIVFQSEQTQKFQQAIYFTLNDNHKLKFGVFAECVPMDISMNQEEMTFRFTEFVLESSLTQCLTLTNPGNSEAEVEWDLSNTKPIVGETNPFLQNFAFSFKPEKGIVPPNGSLLVEVTYTPILSSNESSNELFLKVRGGPSKKLNLSGSVAPTQCSWSLKESKVDFKKVAVGSTRTQIISLRNTGSNNSAVFTFDQANLISGLTVTPARGRVAPNGSVEITIQLRALQPQMIRTTITCHIRGMKTFLKLLVFGEVKIPEFAMSEPTAEVVDFGGIYVGSSELRRMEIENHDDLSTTFFIDLTPHPEFTLYDSDKRPVESSGGDEEELSSGGKVVPGTIAVFQTHSTVDDDDSQSQGGDHTGSADHDPDARKGHKYRVTVNAQQTFSWYLCFSPSSVCHQDSFHLPIVLAGLDNVNDVSLPENCNLNHIVMYSGRKPRLVLSPGMVDFGPRVVIRDGTSKVPNRILIKLMNETDTELEWELDVTKSGLKETFGEIFRIEPTHGKLLSGQSAQVQLTFSPMEVRAYVMKVPVYLDGTRTVPYMEVTVKGFGSNPSLSFDRKEVVLPMVPLDIPARLTFMIINEGFESLDLKYKIPGDGKLVPITLNFPDGQTVMSNKNHVPCEVVFVSKKPLTFSTVIDFIGDDGTIFPIIVTAGADNSLMSTYSYVKWRDQGIQYTCDGDRKPIVAKEIDDTPLDKDAHAVNSKAADAVSMISGQSVDDPTVVFTAVDKCHKKVLSKKSIDRLRMWLNTNVLADPIDELITGLQANHGRPIYEILEVLFGKAVPGMVKPDKLSSNKRDAAMQELEQYNNALSFLRQYGAMIADVRPEFLIKYEDYCRVALPEVGYKGQISGSNATVSRSRVSERKFQFRGMHAWSTVLYQIARMFVVNKITWKAFRTMPQNQVCASIAAVEKWNNQTPDSSVVASNVYSMGEAILLKWLSVHLNALFPRDFGAGLHKGAGKKAIVEDPPTSALMAHSKEPLRVVTFDELKDCKAFAAVLMGYIPSLVMRFDKVRQTADGFLLVCTTPGDYERNASILLDAMKEYGMDTKITPKDFIDSNARDFILFAAYLMNTLPQYVPKTSIKFKGKLHEKITKTIELQNQSKYAVDYQVLLDGSDEFKILENKLHLDARTNASFVVHITPRFSKKVDARLTFLSSRVGTYSGATMIFQLDTEVDTDSAMRTIDDLSTNLYEVLNTELEIENPFNVHGHFTVSYTQERIRDSAKTPEQESAHIFPEAFWTPIDTLNIKKGEKARMLVQFLPFIRGKYKCKFLFCDEKAGEFAYYVIATCLPPKPFETISLVTEAAIGATREITLPLRHVAFDKAMQLKEERFKAFKGRGKAKEDKGVELEAKEVTYTIEFVNDQFIGPNPFYQGPKTFTLKPPTAVAAAAAKGAPPLDTPPLEAALEDVKKKKKDDQDKKKWAVSATGFTIGMNPKGPGLYPCYVMLVSPYDVRCLYIEGRSRSPGMKAELEFNCPARQQIVQDIPITNNTEREWVITATIQGEYFSGGKELRVPAGRVRTYALSFVPIWTCDVQGTLVFRNAESGERYTYILRGRADEPLAENTVPVECRAREFRKVTINVPNITLEEVTYTVETDLPFLQGEPKIVVNKMEVGKYQLTLNPQLSCKITGSVTFIAPNKQYSWYVIQVNVLRPPPESVIDIEAVVRKAVAAEITISNPAKHSIEFSVRRRGDGLMGEDVVSLAPGQSHLYQLIYAPIKAGTSEGTISFYNDDVGEYWYKLAMVAKDADAEQVAFVCELGKSKTSEIVIENPTDQECHLTVNNTNDANFIVTPATLVLKPNGVIRAVITYMPSAIHQEQAAIITLAHPRAGAWLYQCKGKGTPPTKMEVVRVMSQVNYGASFSVVFRNPFPVPKKFSVSMVTLEESSPPVFSLLLKKAVTSLGPFQMLQIPLTYHPSLIAEHRATVAVALVEGTQTTSDLKWDFPVLGVAEAIGTDQVIRISCRSRKEVIQSVDLPLVGLPTGALARESFTNEIGVPSDCKFYRAVLTSVIVTLSTTQPAPGGADTLRYDITFCPLRPFTQTVELLLRKSTGGVWKYEIQLEATPPEVDDVINIAAGVHATQSVSFSLYNVFPVAKAFQAYFTADSAMELGVKPLRGTLPALESAPSGQNFVVTFTSASYGKTVAGTLIIDTDEIQWRYEVHGVLPRYQAPTEVVSRLDTHLSPDVQGRMTASKATKRNFVRQNQSTRVPK